MNKIIFILFIFAILFLFISKSTANAAFIKCQKPNDVVLVVDNSQSIGEPTTGNATPSSQDNSEWPGVMDFIETFVKSFSLDPNFTNASIVTFDGASVNDINNTADDDYDGDPTKKLPGIGDQLYSDTIVGLSSNTAPLMSAIASLRLNRRVPPVYRPWSEYPPYKNPKRYPPPNQSNYGSGSKGFYGGATDIASGIIRAKAILDASPRKSLPNIDRFIVVITDGIPNDETCPIDGNIEINSSKKLIQVVDQAKAEGIKIFAINVGFDYLCYSGYNPASTCAPTLTIGQHCTNNKASATAWNKAIASPTTALDPTNYSFSLSGFNDFQTVVDSIISYACGVENLNVNGFVLVNGDLTLKRAMNANNTMKYLSNSIFFSVLKSYSQSRHFLTFD